eukprot:gene23725-26847_t
MPEVTDYYSEGTALHSKGPTVLHATGAHHKTEEKIVSKVESKHPVDEIKDDPALYNAAMRDRVTLWHNDYEGPRRTAAWIYDYKVILNEFEQMSEMYDLQNDIFEKKNLIVSLPGAKKSVPLDVNIASHGTVVGGAATGGNKITLDMVLHKHVNPAVHEYIASRMYPVLLDFAMYGNRAHSLYLQSNPGWSYSATAKSDMRNDLIRNPEPVRVAQRKHAALLNGTCGATSCTCEVKLAHHVSTLPFESTPTPLTYLRPGKLLNGAQLLGL